jgi:hypothetical protein
MALVTAGSLVLAGAMFVWGLPLLGRSGAGTAKQAGGTQLHLNLVPGGVASARFPDPATSARLTLWVNPVTAFPDCTTNTVNGEPAYLTECTDWLKAGYHVEIFNVTLLSKSDDAIAWTLARLTLHSASGESLAPLESSDDGVSLPWSGTLRPHQVVSGYVAFDTGEGFAPGSLLYQDHEELLVELSGP